MQPTLMYAFAGGAFFSLLLLLYAIVLLVRNLRPWMSFLRMHLFHFLTIPPLHLLWSCTNGQILVELIYVAANVFCCCFDVASAPDASLRAACLSMLNLMPLYFGPHLSFLCGLSGVSLRTYRIFHRSTATMSLLLALVHVVINVDQRSRLEQNGSFGPYGIVVSLFPKQDALLMTLDTGRYRYGRHRCSVFPSLYSSCLRDLPSLPPYTSHRSPLQSMETCSFKKRRNLSACCLLHLRIYPGFRMPPDRVSKLLFLTILFPSLAFETQWCDQDDDIRDSTLEGYGRRVR
jgi:hypothetical protein